MEGESIVSHPQQRFFVNSVKQLLPGFFQGRSVIEVGSLNINGSVREFFSDCSYVGLDVGEGKDVDLVCRGEDYGAGAGGADVLISCEAMEHNAAWKKTWLNMLRLVKDDGLVIMTCATHGRRQHGTADFVPSDSPLTHGQGHNHYCNLAAGDFAAVVNHDAWFSVWAFYQNLSVHDLYFFGVGLQADEQTRAQARRLQTAFQEHYQRVNVLGVY